MEFVAASKDGGGIRVINSCVCGKGGSIVAQQVKVWLALLFNRIEIRGRGWEMRLRHAGGDEGETDEVNNLIMPDVVDQNTAKLHAQNGNTQVR